MQLLQLNFFLNIALDRRKPKNWKKTKIRVAEKYKIWGHAVCKNYKNATSDVALAQMKSSLLFFQIEKCS